MNTQKSSVKTNIKRVHYIISLMTLIFSLFIQRTAVAQSPEVEQKSETQNWQIIKAQLGPMYTRLEYQEAHIKKIHKAVMWSILSGMLTYALFEVLDTMRPHLSDMQRLKKMHGFEKLALFASACTYACLYFFQK